MTNTDRVAIGIYRKKPVEVQAIQWTGDNARALVEFTGKKFDVFTEPCQEDLDATASVFDMLHSTWVLCYTGDWIIRGIRGEFYPCRDDVFRETYEEVFGGRST
jgi:hypothetical protein